MIVEWSLQGQSRVVGGGFDGIDDNVVGDEDEGLPTLYKFVWSFS